jgi:alpha-mannosidase
MERYQHPFVTAAGSGSGPVERRPGLELAGDGVVLTALRRRGDRLELRLACQRPEAAAVRVTGGLTAAREADLLGRPGAELEVRDGGVAVELAPWEIRTLRVER